METTELMEIECDSSRLQITPTPRGILRQLKKKLYFATYQYLLVPISHLFSTKSSKIPKLKMLYKLLTF